MKKTLLILVFHLTTLVVIAQDSYFTDVFANESGKFPLLSLTENSDTKEYLQLTKYDKNSEFKVKFTLLDSTLAVKNNAEYSWPKGANDQVIFLGSEFLHGKFCSLFAVQTESDLSNSLVLAEFENGKVSVKTLDKIEMRNSNNTGGFKVNFSGGKKAVIVLKESIVEKGHTESVQIAVYDEVFNKINETGVSFPVQSKLNPVNKIFVTDKGDIFIIKKDREKTDIKFYLYAFNADLKGWNHRQFSMPAKLIADIDACMNSSQEFIVAGFWNAFDVTSYQGYFYYRFDASLKPSFKKAEKFPVDFFTEFISRKNATKQDAMIDDYWFESLVAAPKNDIYILAEKQMSETTSDGEKFDYEDIMYIRINPEGKFTYGGKVKNNQESLNDRAEWSSFNYAVVKDTLHFFHNELGEPENKSKFRGETFAGTYHSSVTGDNKPNTTPATEMILANDPQLAFYPKYVYHTSDDHLLFLLMSKDKTKFALGKMKLK